MGVGFMPIPKIKLRSQRGGDSTTYGETCRHTQIISWDRYYPRLVVFLLIANSVGNRPCTVGYESL